MEIKRYQQVESTKSRNGKLFEKIEEGAWQELKEMRRGNATHGRVTIHDVYMCS